MKNFAIVGEDSLKISIGVLKTMDWIGFPKLDELKIVPGNAKEISKREREFDQIFLLSNEKEFLDEKFRYKVLFIDDKNLFEIISRIVQFIECMNPWKNSKTHAFFFDVDGTLADFGGPIKPEDIIRKENLVLGFISNRTDETWEKDFQILQEKYNLKTHPIHQREWKVNLLRFVRHIYRNLPPTNFYYVGDKESDKQESITAGWIYLKPEEYKNGVWAKGWVTDFTGVENDRKIQ